MDLEILCEEAEVMTSGLAIPNGKWKALLKNVYITKKIDPTDLDRKLKNFCAGNGLPMPKHPTTEENIVALLDIVFEELHRTKSSLKEQAARSQALYRQNNTMLDQLDGIHRALRGELECDRDHY